MINISKTTENMADSRGLIIISQEVVGINVITIKRKDNNMMLVSFRNAEQSMERQELTTMNAEAFDSIPKNVSSDEEFREVIKSVGDYIS